MNNKIKVAVLKETKTPPDKRAALTPKQAVRFLQHFPNTELYIQSSDIRAFKDEEYSELGLTVTDDVSHCDILIGIKEVEVSELIPEKTYLFFSHTAKKQAYNRKLLQTLLEKKIKMIDYEYLTYENGIRIIAFGRWAGMVGAYNGLRAFGKREGLFQLPQAIQTQGMEAMFAELRKKVKLPPVKLLITGGGRVAQGALETLSVLNIKGVKPKDFLSKHYDYPVYSQLDPGDYVKRKDGKSFELQHFFENPEAYESAFTPYTKVADMYIACHFWDEKSPKFITKEDVEADDFKIRIIADVSCDINGPIAPTIRASEIADPFYGYEPKTHKEGYPFDRFNISVMAVDNLPGEVPRDASEDFATNLIDKIMPALLGEDTEGIISRAIITENGELGEHFRYLADFAAGKE
jgi:saccharopine dehydrogenase (NAD+, L-lysine forming)